MRNDSQLSLRACLLTLTASAALSACAPGAQPEMAGGNSKSGYYETWSAGPFPPSANPGVNDGKARACPAQASGTPACEYHRITPGPEVQNLTVAISPKEGSEGDDFDLAVFDENDNLVAASASSGPSEAVVFPANGSSYYEVRVQPYTVTNGAGYNGAAAQTDTTVDSEPTCDTNALSGESYPDELDVPGMTDSGDVVELSVAVLLDGVDQALAEQVMARAADGYSPLNIKLTVAGVQIAPILSNVSGEMIQEAKDQTGGKPPFGADIVAVFTNKEMQAATGGAGTVLGQADCIGGIRAPYNSYLVATIEPEAPFEVVPGLYLDVERGPETMAHEIGHLMGAHHHYGNCVEGVSPDDAANGDISPCDLMFPSVEPLSLIFSTPAGATVRGHAVQYAAP